VYPAIRWCFTARLGLFLFIGHPAPSGFGVAFIFMLLPFSGRRIRALYLEHKLFPGFFQAAVFEKKSVFGHLQGRFAFRGHFGDGGIGLFFVRFLDHDLFLRGFFQLLLFAEVLHRFQGKIDLKLHGAHGHRIDDVICYAHFLRKKI